MFDSVLTYSVSAQPADPEIDARYLLPPGATGVDWAGKEGRIGAYLESGWHFAVYPIGRLLFIEDQGAYYHRDKNGAWIAGVGSIAIVTSSIAITAIIGASASTRRRLPLCRMHTSADLRPYILGSRANW
jgi:hypothetical protein